MFWTACDSGAIESATHATYAAHFADILCALLRAFVAAAVRRTYEPVR
ncbi:jg10112, partial [Pararge aegeria aegeria]